MGGKHAPPEKGTNADSDGANEPHQSTLHRHLKFEKMFARLSLAVLFLGLMAGVQAASSNYKYHDRVHVLVNSVGSFAAKICIFELFFGKHSCDFDFSLLFRLVVQSGRGISVLLAAFLCTEADNSARWVAGRRLCWQSQAIITLRYSFQRCVSIKF